MPTNRNASLFLAFFALLVLISPVCNARENEKPALRRVVIDAGHGGHDPGALSPDKKLKEKNINLDVALKLGELIKQSYPDVKVIYTRKTDVFIPLVERGNIANRNDADLFISIHVNAVASKKAISGTEVFVMGMDKSERNMEVCKAENSVILLEDDYTTAYQGFDPSSPESYIIFSLMQNSHLEQSIEMASLVERNLKKGPITFSRGVKQAPLLVLWRTTMPSILVEIGFITDAGDRKIISTESGRKEISKRIFDAFSAFKKKYDKALSID